MLNLNKGAMFGLDARIALAIFGSLSVISGAALYSSIQESKIVQRIAQIEEIEKAIAQYYLDTGSMLPFSSTVPAADLSLKALIEKPSGVNSWNGPYLSLAKSSNNVEYLVNPTNGKDIALAYKKNGDWTLDSVCKTSSTNCSLYIVLLDEIDFNDAIEEKLDSNSDLLDGNFKAFGNMQFFKTDVFFDTKNSPNS